MIMILRRYYKDFFRILVCLLFSYNPTWAQSNSSGQSYNELNFISDDILNHITLPGILNISNEKREYKNWIAIPQEMIENNSSIIIGQSIARRLYEKFEQLEVSGEGVDYDFFKNAELQMGFYPSKVIYQDKGIKIIDAIKANGFLNQHQFEFQQTTGVYNPKQRELIENYIANLKIEEEYSDPRKDSKLKQAKAHIIRPKYAFLALKKPLEYKFNKMSETIIYTPPVTLHHGNTIVVFKDEVKSRTTITPYDSFEALSTPEKYWSKVRRTFYSQKIPKEFFMYADKKYYWEVQIWGELTLQDVKYF